MLTVLTDGRYRIKWGHNYYYYRTYLNMMDLDGNVYEVPRTPIGHLDVDRNGRKLPSRVFECSKRTTRQGRIVYTIKQ